MSHVRLARCALFVCLALSCLSLPAFAHAQATPAAQASPVAGAELEAAVAWLQSQQADDGGWVGFSGASDVGVTIDAVLALLAASNQGVAVDLTAATEYLLANGVRYAESGTGQAAKLVLAATALGLSPTNFEGENLMRLLRQGLNRNTDLYGTGLYDHALVILAMTAADAEIRQDAIDEFAGRQLEDGSWAFDGTKIVGNGDTNTTAVVIQALVAVGATEGDQIMHGLEYLASVALPSGYPFQPGPGASADGNSTALVVQALIATGEDPAAQEWQNVAGSLLAFQNDSGSFSYLLDPRDENLFATVQIIPALAGQPLPITASSDDATPAASPTCTPEQRTGTPSADADLPCAA